MPSLKKGSESVGYSMDICRAEYKDICMYKIYTQLSQEEVVINYALFVYTYI